MEPSEYRRRQRFHIVAAGLGGLFAGGLTQYLAFAARRMGATVTMVAMLTALPSVVLVGAFLYAHSLDRFRSTIRTGVPHIVGCVILLGLAATRSPAWFVTVGIIGTLCLSVSWTFKGSLIDDLYPARKRGRLLALPMTAGMFTTILANYVVGRLLDIHPDYYRPVFVGCAIVGVISGLAIIAIPLPKPARPSARQDPVGDLLAVFRDRRFLTWTLIYSVTTLPYWLGVPAMPVFFSDELRLDHESFGYTQIALNATMLAGFLWAGRLLDRRGSVRIMAAAWLAVAASQLILSQCHSLGLAVLAQGLHGSGMALNEIAWFPVVLEFAPRDKVSRYMGVYVSVFGLRSLIGSWLGGVVMNNAAGGSRTALLLAGALTLPGCLLIVLRRRALTTGSTRRPRPKT